MIEIPAGYRLQPLCEFDAYRSILEKNEKLEKALENLLDVFKRCEAGYPPNIELRFLAKELAEKALKNEQ